MARARTIFVHALRVQLLWLLRCQLARPCEQRSSSDTSVLCRACGQELASGADIRFVPSRLALSTRNDTLVNGRRVNVQLFENPHGVQFEVVTFRKADVTQHWPADERFSWFPGFSWTVATCPRCRSHAGPSSRRNGQTQSLRSPAPLWL
ncbi:protein cereblon isoform X2 [Oryzias latipes]|uniref:protein cereblon isoform X2 n=1 Tax=Oryzias latipes TaxID=8090 RepID=UPI000CE24A90|nr:protein cereblon isoform X2 [Oryzias latipes]